MKNAKRKNYQKKRIKFIMRIFLLLLVLVGVVRIFYIKQKFGQEYEVYAIENQANKVQDTIISPNRGSILDRNNQVLSISNIVYNVILDIKVIDTFSEEEKEKIKSTVSEILDIDLSEINEYFAKDSNGELIYNTNWKIIKKKVDYEIGKKLEDEGLKGVYLEKDYKRSYPYGNLASQVIGFVRGDAMWGLESQYNEELTGTTGRIYRTYEDDNSFVTNEIEPIKGNTIVTTLDLTIQQFAEEIVKKTYENAKPDHNAKNVSMLVMNPNTGEIIAMAEYPNFNLNEPTEISLLEDSIYKELIPNMSEEEKTKITNEVWKNFAITETFEPGSTFKPLVVATALEEGVISETETFYCNGFKKYGKDIIRCHNRSGHGEQTLEQALANSCNVAMMDIVEKLGADKFYDYQRNFGFGEKTGVDLPGEVDASNLMYDKESLNTVELATSSFGQGFNSTSLQILNGFAATINGGNLMKPYLVSQIIDEKGEVIKENTPEIVRKVISQETSDYLRTALQKVVSSEGTAKNAVIEGYSIGGKTGTAQQGDRSKNMYTLSFIAYLPVENPEYIAMSVIHYPENYYTGSISPVPMIKELFENIIKYKGLKPTTEVEMTSESTTTTSDVWLEDYTGKSLKETVKELSQLNIDFQISGGGDTITKTIPSGNTKIDKNTKIILYVGNQNENSEIMIVPNVLGLTLSQATEILTNSGFEVKVENINVEENIEVAGEQLILNESTEEMQEFSISDEEKVEDNTEVINQIPEPELRIEKGTIVKLIIKEN